MKRTYLASTALFLALATPALALEKTDVLGNYADIAAAKAAMTDNGIMISTGTGSLVKVAHGKTVKRQISGLQWDNHLIGITTG